MERGGSENLRYARKLLHFRPATNKICMLLDCVTECILIHFVVALCSTPACPHRWFLHKAVFVVRPFRL